MYGHFPTYISVAERRANAKHAMDKLRKKGMKICPIEIEGRTIATTFWGKAWCNHLESFSDYSNRLSRGRTYARNGSVCHLDVDKRTIKAIVSGSDLYNINVDIKPLAKEKWAKVQEKCSGEIGSMLELLQGKISSSVMATVTNTTEGLFPLPKEIDFSCDCPDSAYMCKHVAAVLYGIGARLDDSPELLFLLRDVNHEDLISSTLSMTTSITSSITTEKSHTTGKSRKRVKGDLTDIFDIDLELELKRPTKKTAKKSLSSNKPNPTKKSRATTAPKTITAASIKRLKKKLALNNTQFAKLLNVSPATVSNWEKQTGKLNLRDHNRERVIFVFGLEKDDVIGSGGL